MEISGEKPASLVQLLMEKLACPHGFWIDLAQDFLAQF